MSRVRVVMPSGLRRNIRCSENSGGGDGGDEDLEWRCWSREWVTYAALVLALIGYVLVIAVLIMLVVAATFEKSKQDGALCTVLLALWVVAGWCAYRCTVDDMREKERRRRGEVPPTYSRSNLESGVVDRDGRDERQPLLGAVSARAGGSIQVQVGTDSDE